jgi:hypothetical protein
MSCTKITSSGIVLDFVYGVWHKVRTYKEYHSVCPSSELGLSLPLSRQRVFPSPQKQGGGGTLACGWGVGGESQFRGAYTVVLFICTYFVVYGIVVIQNLSRLGSSCTHGTEPRQTVKFFVYVLRLGF